MIRTRTANARYRLGFHIAPREGWINDPNGLCQFRGVYHAFFQYNPIWPKIDIKYWRHFTSDDLVHWRDEGTSLVNDLAEDRNGVFSGSAVVRHGAASDGGDLMCLYYTGNVVYPDDPEAAVDYIHSGREANEILVTSEDGETFSEKQVLLRNADYPDVCTLHVRDPKVWEQDGLMWMLLGARDLDDQGFVLLYSSEDGSTWRIKSQVYSEHPFGYMWECPNIVQLDGRDFLAVCPQGLPDEPDRWQNRWQSGYFPLGDSILNTVLVDETRFVEWDLGYDFYAPQTFVDDAGRSILIGWMGTFEEDNRTSNPGGLHWIHCLTVAREITLGDNGMLRQWPVSELEALRGEATPLSSAHAATFAEHRADVVLEGIVGNGAVTLDDVLEIAYAEGRLTVSFRDPRVAAGRVNRTVPLAPLTSLRVLIDSSAIEIYANEGATVFSSRWFPVASELTVGISFAAERACAYPMANAMANAFDD